MALIGEMRYLQIGGNTYEIPTSELPIASSSTLGGIKVGTNLSIDSSTGVLSVTGIPTKIDDITTYDNFGIGYIDCNSSDRRIFVSNVKFGSSGDADYSSSFLLMFQNGNARYGTVTVPGSGNFRFYNINTNQLLNYNTYVNYTNLEYGKLYIAYMNDNILVIKSIAETTDIPTIPTNISAFTNDAGYITDYTETDPVFSASVAAEISSTDITNWNSKVSDTGKWNDVSLNKTISDLSNQEAVVPFLWDSSDTIARFAKVSKVPSYNCIAQYNNGYLNSTTPSANDNSTKVATTAYVDAAIPTVSITQNLTSGTKSATININGTDYDIYSETNTDTKVTQIPLSGVNSNRGLLFASSVGSTQYTDTVYTSNKIWYNDYSQILTIYDSSKTKYGSFRYDSLSLASNSYRGTLRVDGITASRTYTLPDATGTIALTSDIHSIPTGGTAGQFLVKSSSTDYDAAWVTVPSANGVSF